MARDAQGRFIKGSGGGGTKIKDTDHGYKALVARMTAAAAGARLSVGIHEAEGSLPDESGEATVLDVATINEFGGADNNPPERSFLGAWSDENIEQNKELFRRSAKAVVKGQLPSMTVALERLGLRFVGEVQQRIRAGIAPENAESTIARKGSSTPLINGGQLWSSVTHEVTQGSGEK